MDMWEIKLFFKHKWQQFRSGNAYRYLITRIRSGNEYYDNIEFIKAEDLPADAKRIKNYPDYWYYRELDMCPTDRERSYRDMDAIAIKTWADNSSFDKALAGIWNWTNNLDIKKILMIGAVAIVAIVLFMAVKP